MHPHIKWRMEIWIWLVHPPIHTKYCNIVTCLAALLPYTKLDNGYGPRTVASIPALCSVDCNRGSIWWQSSTLDWLLESVVKVME